MKKLSRIIKESIWSDIHKRSNGVQTRKEDNVNFLEPDGFVDYIRKNYRFDYTPVGIENRTNYSTIFIPICTAGTKNIKLGAIYFEYDEGVVYTHSSIKKYIPELWAKLDQEFDLWDDDPDYRNYTIINPKDTSRKITNSFVLEVLDFIINNIDDSVRLCITKKTNESVWADIHRRSNGTQERKEDSIDSFDEENFWEYLNKTYISKEPSRDIISYPIDNVISIPFVCDGLYYNFYIEYNIGKDEIKYITIPDRFISFYENIENTFKLNMHPHEDNRVCICPKDGTDITNSFAVKVIDFLLDTKDKKTYGLFIKKERS